jgi:hypothetical protein
MTNFESAEQLPNTYKAIVEGEQSSPGWLSDPSDGGVRSRMIINPSEYPEYAAWSRFVLDTFKGDGLIPLPGASPPFGHSAQEWGEGKSESVFLSIYNGFVDAELMDGWVGFDWADAFMLLVDDTPNYREYIRAAVIADGDIAESHGRDYAYSVEQFVLPYRVPGHRQVIDRPFRAPILKAPDDWAPELRFPKS